MPSTLCSCRRDNRLLVLNGSIRSLRAVHICFGRFFPRWNDFSETYIRVCLLK